VDAEDDRQRAVDLPDRLEHPRVAGLREALAAVLLVDVEPEDPALAERGDRLVADPALLLDRARVVVLRAVLAQRGDQAADLLLLGVVGTREGEDEVVVDLAEEQGLGEGGDGVAARLLLLDGRCGFDALRLVMLLLAALLLRRACAVLLFALAFLLHGWGSRGGQLEGPTTSDRPVA
jgi:hypothetical protein